MSMRTFLLASCAVLAAACSSSSGTIDHPSSGPVIVVSRDDVVSGGLQSLGGPEIVVFGDGAAVVRRFTSDNLPRRAQFDDATMQRLLRAARSAGLLRVAPADEAGTVAHGVTTSAATKLTITTDAGSFTHATVETNGPTPGQSRLIAFLTTLRDTVESTTGAPFIASAWLVVDGAHCRLVPGGTRPANVDFARALFPNETGQPLASLSEACA